MIALDNSTNSGYQAASSSYNWVHNCGGSYRILVVSTALLNVANSVTSITYNSVSLTKLRSDVDGTGTIRTEIWYLVAPATGPNTLVVNLNTASVSGSGATSYVGVDQFHPIDAQNGTTGTTGAGGGSASISTTVITDSAWLVDCVATTDTSITVGAGQTQRANITGAIGSGGQSDKQVGAGAQTMQWDNVGALLNWTMSSAALLPSANPTTTSTSSTSASTFSTSSTSASTSSTSSSISSTSLSTSTSSTSTSFSSTSSSVSSTSSSTSSTSTSSTSSSTSVSSTSSSISSTSFSSTSQSSTSSSTSMSSTSSSISSTSSSISSTSFSTSSTSTSSTSSSSSTSTTTLPPPYITYSYADLALSISQLQVTTGSTGATFPLTITSKAFGKPVTAGNTILVAIMLDGETTSGLVTSVTDSLGNSYASAVESFNNGIDDVYIYYGYITNPGAGNRVTANWSSGNTTAAIIAEEWSGLIQNSLDQTAVSNDGGSNLPSVGPTPTTTQAIELCWAAFAVSSATLKPQAGKSYSNLTTAVSSPSMLSTESRVVTATGAQTATVSYGTGTGSDTQALATFKSLTTIAPTNNNLPNSFNVWMYSDVAADDGDYFVEYGSEYMIREYKKKWINNTDKITFTWRGRSTLACSISPILIQIYNVTSSSWETLARETRIPADTDFSATVSQSTNLSNYYDSTNTVTLRSYQLII